MPDVHNPNKYNDLQNETNSGCTDGCRTSPENVPEVASAGPSTTVPDEPDLARIMTAWPDLPDHIKRAMLALVDSADG